jgi:hypothetical protein
MTEKQDDEKPIKLGRFRSVKALREKYTRILNLDAKVRPLVREYLGDGKQSDVDIAAAMFHLFAIAIMDLKDRRVCNITDNAMRMLRQFDVGRDVLSDFDSIGDLEVAIRRADIKEKLAQEREEQRKEKLAQRREKRREKKLARQLEEQGR